MLQYANSLLLQLHHLHINYCYINSSKSVCSTLSSSRLAMIIKSKASTSFVAVQSEFGIHVLFVCLFF